MSVNYTSPALMAIYQVLDNDLKSKTTHHLRDSKDINYIHDLESALTHIPIRWKQCEVLNEERSKVVSNIERKKQ